MNIIREVDHFFIQSDQPALVFEQLESNLGLPVIWPLADYGEYSSGGFWVGNTMLEVAGFKEHPLDTGHLASFRGVAFEPVLPIRSCLRELTRRGLATEATNWNAPVDGPEPDEKVGGHINLPSLGGDATVFILAFPFNPIPFPEDRREELIAAHPKTMADARRVLRAPPGKPFGTFGVLGVEEIVFGTTDLETAQTEWNLLLGERNGMQSTWNLEQAPNIRLVSSDVDTILGVTMRVPSLEDARISSKNTELDATSTDQGELVVRPVAGVEIRLIQS